MAFKYDSTGVSPVGSFEPIPEGLYDLEIDEVVEAETKEKHYPMVKVTCVVVNNKEHSGRKVFHNVTFIPRTEKGAGIAVHWLKTIGQPFEGEYIVNPEAWKGHKFAASVIVDEYNGKKNNKIASIFPYDYTKEKDDLQF